MAAVVEDFTAEGASKAVEATLATVEEAIPAAIVAVGTMVGAAATAGVADIGVIQDTVTDGDLDLGLAGHIGGNIRMGTATAPGGMLLILTITQTIVLLAIRAHTTGTMILLRLTPDQAPTRMESRDRGDHPCREGLATQTRQQRTATPLRRVLRFCPLTE